MWLVLLYFLIVIFLKAAVSPLIVLVFNIGKKYAVVTTVLLLILVHSMSFWLIACGYRNLLYINTGMFLPNPSKVEDIYQLDFQDGGSLEIWHYNSRQIKKIQEKYPFKKINNEIDVKIEEYISSLDEKETEKFNANVNLETLLVEDNYYLYIESDDLGRNFSIFILDTKENKMYYLDFVS